MDSLKLLGQVGARIIADELSRANFGTDAGTSRFLLDRLHNDQTVAIVRSVLDDPALSRRVFIAVPSIVAVGADLPAQVVTEQRAVHFRHRLPPGGEQALLLVNIDDDQGPSLQDMTRIGAKMLTDRIEVWVDIAWAGLNRPQADYDTWISALRGLTDAKQLAVGQLAKYVAAVRERMFTEGQALQACLGYCLPVLDLPRDSALTIAEKQQKQRSAWRRKFDVFFHERHQLLRKQTKSRQLLEREDLRAHFEKVRDDIDAQFWPTIEDFIESPQTWNDTSAALAELEWEKDRIEQLFTGLKLRKVSLAQETLGFYHDKDDKLLDKEDREYLELLSEQGKKQPGEDDRSFYEHHQSLLAERPPLKAKWDKFIFGSSIECSDLLVGLVQALQRLKAQVDVWSGKKTLRIEWNARGRTQFLSINADVGVLFSLRYRGLRELCGPLVDWRMGPLFEYEAFLEKQRGAKRYKRNESTSRAALRIRLDVSLLVDDGIAGQVQVDYLGRPEAVSANLAEDLRRLAARPFAELSVQRVRTSKKGQAQRVALEDAGSFEAAFDQDAGSFVPPIRDIKHFESRWKDSFDAARSTIPSAEAAPIAALWATFREQYKNAVADLRRIGPNAVAVGEQLSAYTRLIAAIEPLSRDDFVRRELLAPLLRLGVVQIRDDVPAAIVTPWNPLRMAGMATKLNSVAALIAHLLETDSVEVGDERLFFEDLARELAHPYYPEVVVGFGSGDPSLLSVSETVDDYSLAESPINSNGDPRTNENPADGAQRVRDVVGRYLSLQPHENASLSVALFECDSAGLPLAAVNALNTLQEQEVHCNVTLRHRDRRALQRVYNDLLEQSAADPDALVASETSRNFMARLRVGIHVDPPGATTDGDCREVDIAYLQDVVARRGRIDWRELRLESSPPPLVTHVPPRWAYKAPTTSESATRYLACPEQPHEGWVYLAGVAAMLRRQPAPEGYRHLPVRSISLSDAAIKQTFLDAHNLAEWVVNYDDLLDPEQLRHQGVRVIRYQKDKSNGRNIIVSSTSRSRVLEVLLRRRVTELGYASDEQQLVRLVRQLATDATDISGELVLRASKRGTAAGELIGVVLSAQLVREELGEARVACFFLDDYASWLGQKESGIADLLMLAINPDNPSRVRIVVTEAKYVSSGTASDARKTSRRQVEATVGKIKDALFENPGRLDRDLWLSRLSDLLLDAAQTPLEEQLFDSVRRKLRAGTIEIDLRGYSHVFVTDSEHSIVDEQEPLSDRCGAHSIQEVFSQSTVREMINQLANGLALRPLRQRAGAATPWTATDWRPPAALSKWAARHSCSANVAAAAEVGTPHAELPATADLDHDAPTTRERSGGGAVPALVSPIDDSQPRPLVALPTADPALSVDQLVSSRKEADTEDSAASQWLEAAARALQRALVGWQLQAKILGTRLTPNAGLIRLLGSDRLETKDMETNRQRLLTTHSLNVISVTPRPGEIVVAIERPNRQVVSLWQVWNRVPQRRGSTTNMSLLVGVRELDGEPLFLNLGDAAFGQQSHAPHTLIAGTTGSGKSILIQNLLLDIALTNSPRDAQIYCIDPKMGVDYVALDSLPHLCGGIVVEQDAARAVLEHLVEVMDARYRQFAQARVPNLRAFNARPDVVEKLPTIFVIHDEFAEWMLTDEYKDMVSSTVKRLGVKARAAGIHLFFAAQRPDKDVMPPQLRENLGNRLILRVEGEGTSEIALGQRGAERLLGKGHCAARLQNESDIIYLQVPWLNGEDAQAVVKAICNMYPRKEAP